jgi:ComF family protein
MYAHIREWFGDFVALFYPHYCLGCGSGLAKGEETLCTQCRVELPRTHYHLHTDNPVMKRLQGRLPLTHAYAFLHFRKFGIVQRLMHELKYHHHPEIALTLGRVFGHELHASAKRYEAIVPVPLHITKKRRRGFNQSEEFARGLSETMQCPMLPNAVVRTYQTETQTRKSRLLRWYNVATAFRVTDANALTNKHVLLVDDVITTGATVEACGRALLQAGCASLSIAGIAYAEQ